MEARAQYPRWKRSSVFGKFEPKRQCLQYLLCWTTSCGYHGFRREKFLRVSPLMEANHSCGMASLDTSSMDVGMTVFSHYNSMGGVYARDQIQLAPKPHSLPDDALYLI